MRCSNYICGAECLQTKSGYLFRDGEVAGIWLSQFTQILRLMGFRGLFDEHINISTGDA
jgi:hypothetical protein